MTEAQVTFIVTFGQRYAREPHAVVDWAHPDGWLQITFESSGDPVEDINAARTVANELLDRGWSGLYRATDFNPAIFTLGTLATWVDGELTVLHHFRQAMVEVTHDAL